MIKERDIAVTSGLGVGLIIGKTILTDKQLLKLFDKNKYGLFVGNEPNIKRIDLK